MKIAGRTYILLVDDVLLIQYAVAIVAARPKAFHGSFLLENIRLYEKEPLHTKRFHIIKQDRGHHQQAFPIP